MSVTPEIETEILALYRQNPKRFSPVKASRQVGVSLGEVMAVVNRNKEHLTDGREHNGGAGRDDLQRYIVASRRANEAGWNNEDAGVIRAREAFCAGTHTMATHRDGAWLHLCLFPLARKVAPRPTYFIPGAA